MLILFSLSTNGGSVHNNMHLSLLRKKQKQNLEQIARVEQ